MKIIKKFFINLFNFKSELNKNEEKELLERIYRKIKEA